MKLDLQNNMQANVIAPNKHLSASETMYKGHLLESETYIGGKVEALESGVFRSDLPTTFRVKPSAYQARVQLVHILNIQMNLACWTKSRSKAWLKSSASQFTEFSMELHCQ